MPSPLDDLRADIRAGSTTFHLGSGRRPLAWFLRAAAVAAVMGATVPAMAADVTAASAAATGRQAAAQELMSVVNAKLERPIGLMVDLSAADGEHGTRGGRIVVGAKGRGATVCTTYADGGADEPIGIIEGDDRTVSWVDAPVAASAAFKYALAKQIAPCLQDAKVLGSSTAPASRLATWDGDVGGGQAMAAAVMLTSMAGGDLKAIETERADLANSLGDVSSRRYAAIIGDAARVGADGRLAGASWSSVGDIAAEIAAKDLKFQLRADGRWVAPDGKIVSTNPKDRDFGWRKVPASGGPYYERRFNDPELAQEEAATEQVIDPGLLDVAAQVQRDSEFAEEKVLYRGHDATGRECAEDAVSPPSGGTPMVAAFCRAKGDKDWELVGPRVMERDAAQPTSSCGKAVAPPDKAARLGDDGVWSLAMEGRHAAADKRGWVVAGDDVGHGGTEVLIRQDGTNVFRDGHGHVTAMVGGPKHLSVGFREEGGRTVQYDLAAMSPASPGLGRGGA